jgi:DNA-binding GntR family transcriptional regulator
MTKPRSTKPGVTKPGSTKPSTKTAAATSKVAAKKASGASRSKAVGVNEVVEWVRDRIRFGRFAPGQRLVEADIIRELDASRGRVREALQRLATEGVVTIEEFRGASVKHLTRSEVQQMYRARMALEGLAAAEFAGADAAALKKRLAGVQEELNALEHLGNHEQFARLNDEWHRLIIEGSGNQYIKGFLDRLRVPVYRLLFSTFYNARRIDKANAGHRKITAAIVAGRAKDAERLMRDHIEEGLSALNTLGAEFFN